MITHARLTCKLVTPSVTLRFQCSHAKGEAILSPNKIDFLLINTKHLQSTLSGRGTVYPCLVQALYCLTSFNKKRGKKTPKYSHDTAPFWPLSPAKPCCPGIPGGPGGPRSHNPSPKKKQEGFHDQTVLEYMHSA